MTKKSSWIFFCGICLCGLLFMVAAAQPRGEQVPSVSRPSTQVPNSSGQDPLTSVFNVKSFGAKGNGQDDDTASLRQAVAAVAKAGGGRLFFPNGSYAVTGPIDLPSNIIIEGTSAAYNGVCQIRLIRPNQALFTIGENKKDITIRDIELKAAPKSVTPYVIQEGTTAILAKGEQPNSTYNIAFRNLMITGFDRGIFVDGLSKSGEWQFDHVVVDHCSFIEVNYGIYLDSENAAYWKISNCWFGVLPGGIGMYLHRAGFVQIESTAGGGPAQKGPNLARAFISVTGMIAALNINNSEAEGFDNFLVAAEPSNYAAPITVTSCLIPHVLFTGNFVYNSIGNLYAQGGVTTSGNANDVLVNSIGDAVDEKMNSLQIIHGLTAFNLQGNGRVNFNSGTFDTTFGNLTTFRQHVGIGIPPAANGAVLTVATAADNEPQLRLGSPNFFYDLFRDTTGYLVFRGNQPGYTGYRFNGDLVPDRDGQGNVGVKGARWNTVRAVNVTSGDTILSDKKTGEELYRLREDENNIYFEDIRTGKQMMRLDREGNLHVKGKVVENSD